MISNYSETIEEKSHKAGANLSPSDQMPQIFGKFPESFPNRREYLLLVFSPSSLPLKKWGRNSGLSADFLADYWQTFFPGEREDNAENLRKQAEFQDTVSYIANELLENAMKFSDRHSDQPISIQLQLYSDKLVFLVTNSIQAEGKNNYQSFIENAIASDPQEMLLSLLEKNAEADTLESSGLGLVTIMNDYQGQLGWKFETLAENPATMMVTTMVQVPI